MAGKLLGRAGRSRARRIAARTLGVAAVGAALVAIDSDGRGGARPPAAQAQAPAGEAMLPDLLQRAPRQLVIVKRRSKRGTRHLLAFYSAVENHGRGPLTIEGTRPSTAQKTMTADQIVQRSEGESERRPGVGRLRYVRSKDHEHFHLLGFDRYELKAADGRSLGRDRKTGFCLSDRYDIDFFAELPFEPPGPVYRRQCGKGKPRRLSLIEGISVGYGDYYTPNLEGQYIDVTGIEAGRYVLVHHVNSGRRLLDADHTNDASSALLRLGRKRGELEVSLLRSCQGTSDCPAEGG